MSYLSAVSCNVDAFNCNSDALVARSIQFPALRAFVWIPVVVFVSSPQSCHLVEQVHLCWRFRYVLIVIQVSLSLLPLSCIPSSRNG